MTSDTFSLATGQDPFSLARLQQDAIGASGLTDWGQPTFFPTLELLIESCRATACLTPSGWALLRKVALRHLRNQLYLQAFSVAHPEGLRAPIMGPVVITGLPRTGTTLLHNLLALDPANRVLRFWEGLHPVPVSTDAARAALIEQAKHWLARLYELTPAFRLIHYSTAEGPEECDALLQNAFASQHFDDMFRAEEYSAWLNQSALTPEYGYYGRQLQVLSAADISPRPWILKSPSHLGYLDTVLKTFPGVLIVQCHRDPIEAVASYASLVQAVRSPHSEHVSPVDVGRHALRRCAVATDRAMAGREQGADDQFFDVSYSRLVGDPFAVIKELYWRLGRSLGEAEGSMLAWLQENPQHRHGRHDYSLDRFGLRGDAVRDRMAPYCDRFGAETS